MVGSGDVERVMRSDVVESNDEVVESIFKLKLAVGRIVVVEIEEEVVDVSTGIEAVDETGIVDMVVGLEVVEVGEEVEGGMAVVVSFSTKCLVDR